MTPSALLGGRFFGPWQQITNRPLLPRLVTFIGYDVLPETITEGNRLRRRPWLLGLTSMEMANREGVDHGTLLYRGKSKGTTQSAAPEALIQRV